MNFFNEKNLKKIVFGSLICLSSVLSILFGTIHIAEKILEIKKDFPALEKEFMEYQKRELKTAVDMQIKHIDFHRNQLKEDLKESIHFRVSDAKKITETMVWQNRGRPISELKTLSKQLIRPFRFNDNRGYIFAIGMDGYFKIYPPDPSVEGKSVDTVFDKEKLKIVNEFFDIAKSSGSGFIEYNWPISGSSPFKTYRKVSYVTYIESYDWIIGAGEYLEDFGATQKENVLKDISKIMGPDSENYFFIYQLHSINGGKDFATMILNPNRPDLIGKKISDDYRGSKGNEFRKDFLRGICNRGDAFVTYWYKKPGKKEIGRKLSYFKLYPEWNWVVAKGAYLDKMDQTLSDQRQEIKARIKNELILFVLVFFISVIFMFFLAKIFSEAIDSIFQRYKSVQEQQRLELKKMNKILQKQATTDTLTGLHNRKHYNSRLEQEILRVGRYNNTLSLILFDIDHFKKINDDFGHLAGDAVLKELSKLIGSQVRKTDVFARWGGEEFIILLLESDKTTALKLAEKYCRMVAGHKFSIDRKVTCSFGVTEYRPSESAEDFLHRADECLYEAKNSGRNCVASC